jgi:hypothetical protein
MTSLFDVPKDLGRDFVEKAVAFLQSAIKEDPEDPEGCLLDGYTTLWYHVVDKISPQCVDPTLPEKRELPTSFSELICTPRYSQLIFRSDAQDTAHGIVVGSFLFKFSHREESVMLYLERTAFPNKHGMRSAIMTDSIFPIRDTHRIFPDTYIHSKPLADLPRPDMSLYQALVFCHEHTGPSFFSNLPMTPSRIPDSNDGNYELVYEHGPVLAVRGTTLCLLTSENKQAMLGGARLAELCAIHSKESTIKHTTDIFVSNGLCALAKALGIRVTIPFSVIVNLSSPTHGDSRWAFERQPPNKSDLARINSHFDLSLSPL